MIKLDSLLEPEFLDPLGSIATREGLHFALRRSDVVARVGLAVKVGSVGESEIRDFVASLGNRIVQGEQFWGDVVFAALAVALTKNASPFAEEYLRSLGGLAGLELPMGPSVARLVLLRRAAEIPAATVARIVHLPADPAVGVAHYINSASADSPRTVFPQSAIVRVRRNEPTRGAHV